MDQPKINENIEKTPSDIDFHDLEAILQRGLGNTEFKVVNHRSECLLPAGENYSSLVIKIDATIRSEGDGEKEVLHLVAKAKIPGEKYVDAWIVCINKEIYAYTELLPTYKEIEREAGVPEAELIDVMPKYMGHRNSFKSNDEVDKDSIILMENMKMKGYYNFNRHTGLSLEPTEKALVSLARYHALGIAMKEKSPTFTEIANRIAETKFTDDTIEEAYDVVRKGFQKYSHLTQYIDIIETSILYMLDKWFSSEEKPEGLWDSISHGDFWSNNILFHKNNKGQIDDVKFVDWAMYYHCSVLADLPYFLCTSVQRAVLDEHFDDLLGLYYKTFIATLERVGCDAAMFTRESFDVELKQQAINEIAMIALAIKFIHYQVDKGDEENRELYLNVFASESDAYGVSLTRIIDIYKSREWL